MASVLARQSVPRAAMQCDLSTRMYTPYGIFGGDLVRRELHRFFSEFARVQSGYLILSRHSRRLLVPHASMLAIGITELRPSARSTHENFRSSIHRPIHRSPTKSQHDHHDHLDSSWGLKLRYLFDSAHFQNAALATYGQARLPLPPLPPSACHS